MSDPVQRLRVNLTNNLEAETIIYWHGPILPNVQDGVSYTNLVFATGASDPYDYAPNPGSFWTQPRVPAREIDLADQSVSSRSGDV